MKTKVPELMIRLLLALICANLVLLTKTADAQVLFSSGSYSQNFDSLPTTGGTGGNYPWTNNLTLLGWYAASQAPASAATNVAGGYTNIIVSAGTGNAGALYDFGTNGVNSGSDRALGSISSGTPLNIAYGVLFTNDTGHALSNITVAYTGEQWRNASNTTAQPLAFSYRISSAPILNSDPGLSNTWTAVTALNFTSPNVVNIAPLSGMGIDGNASTNRTVIPATSLPGAVVLPGQEIFLRWLDVNDAGNDHALAVDDLTVTFITNDTAVATAPTITTNPVSRTIAESQSATFNVSASGTAPLAYLWYSTNAGVATLLPDNGTSSTTNYVPVAASGTGFYVIVTNAQGAATSSVATLTVTNLPLVGTTIQFLHTRLDANFICNDTTSLYCVTGVVTTAANLVAGSSVYSFHIQQGNYGIDVFHRGGFPVLVPSLGNLIEVKASLTNFSGLLELQAVSNNFLHSLTDLGPGTPATPNIFDYSTIVPSTMESLIEGSYVVISNVYMGTTAYTAGSSFFVTNLLGQTFRVSIPGPATTTFSGTPPLFTPAIRGVISQNTGTLPATNGYSLLLSQEADVDPGITPPSTNSALSALTLSTGALVPAFDANTLSYTSAVANATTSATVTPTVADPTATIQVRVNGGAYSPVTSGNPSGSLALNVGANPIDVQVTSQIGTTVTTYTVTVTRAGISAPTPVTLNISTNAGNAVLTWTDSTGLFKLASGTNLTGITNVIGTVSPVTTPISGSQTYYRLIWP